MRWWLPMDHRRHVTDPQFQCHWPAISVSLARNLSVTGPQSQCHWPTISVLLSPLPFTQCDGRNVDNTTKKEVAFFYGAIFFMCVRRAETCLRGPKNELRINGARALWQNPQHNLWHLGTELACAPTKRSKSPWDLATLTSVLHWWIQV